MDIVESFAAVKARSDDVWPFLTRVDRAAMWLSPAFKVVAGREGDTDLRPGTVLKVVWSVPIKTVFTCQVLVPDSVEPDRSLTAKVQRVQFEGRWGEGLGAIHGLSLWRVVSVGEETLVHHRLECGLSGSLIGRALWTLLMRWLIILNMNWAIRRLKARVEDTVGTSVFGLPLLVTEHALIAGAAGVALLVAACAVKMHKRLARTK